jgi:hypothetical protein
MKLPRGLSGEDLVKHLSLQASTSAITSEGKSAS